MPELHYHPLFAWNLVWDLILSKEIKANEIGSYVQQQLDKARPQLTEENQQISREMLVFADRVLLPGELDVPLPRHLRDAGHIDFWSSASQSLSEARWRLKRQEYMHDQLRMLAPMLLELQEAEYHITDQQLERLFNYWEECEQWEENTRKKVNEETWQAIDVMRGTPFMQDLILSAQSAETQKSLRELLKTDPKRHEDEFSELAERVRPLTSLVVEATVLESHNIPTLFRHRPALDKIALTGIPTNIAETLTGVVGIYFENILAPRPGTFHDALKMRDAPELLEWRKKIDEWTTLLRSSPDKLRDVKMQIQDANNYIGIALPKHKVGVVRRFLPWITWPLGLIGKVTGFDPAEFAALGIEGIKLAGKAVTASIRSPDRLQYRWVMLSASAASEKADE
jgi:hypothetical protein